MIKYSSHNNLMDGKIIIRSNNSVFINEISIHAIKEIRTAEQSFDLDYFLTEYFKNGWLSFDRWITAYENRITYINSENRVLNIINEVHLENGKIHNLIGPSIIRYKLDTLELESKVYFINGDYYFKEEFYKHKDVIIAHREAKLKRVLGSETLL